LKKGVVGKNLKGAGAGEYNTPRDDRKVSIRTKKKGLGRTSSRYTNPKRSTVEHLKNVAEKGDQRAWETTPPPPNPQSWKKKKPGKGTAFPRARSAIATKKTLSKKPHGGRVWGVR